MAERFFLSDYVYAHRGLWGAGCVENTLPAFQAAIDAGLGIEFDVRLTADNEVVVFHDSDLSRLSDRTDNINQLSCTQLQDVPLILGARIPTFRELLDMWPRDLPLLTEMKVDKDTDPVALAHQTGKMLLAHKGLVAAMSFSEACVRALPDGFMRGQLVGPSETIGANSFESIIERAVADGIDYVAVNISDVSKAAELIPANYPRVTWTVRTESEAQEAADKKAAIIFELLAPALVTGIAMP
ncbi:MAG: hypothetical protein GYB49_01390 [Alphaproteobacteria bacterium]|nr:hypothetical protein [Hyphomonas sp.]MBR9805864.1 hypothetical protein [Alphaproteobacteria bacterium]|tara:strand:- start:1029 stop:1754 length:726 start_codon:yes stop_codon:yes gene_type:complete